MKTTKHDRIGIVLSLTPALLLILVFLIVLIPPVGVTSFFKWNGITAPEFTGWQNCAKIFSDKASWHSARNNLVWVASVCLVQIPLALIMVMVLSTKPRGWKIFRAAYFLPQVISSIAIAVPRSAVYSSEFGLLNGLLKLVGREDSTHNWLGNPKAAFTYVLMYGLFYVGYFIVILIVRISGIDESYYEAATISNASRLQIGWHITIPLIRYSIITCVTLATVYTLHTFEQLYLFTNGGPANRTLVLVLYLCNQIRNNNYGGTSTSSMMLILAGALVVIAVRRLFAEKRR